MVPTILEWYKRYPRDTNPKTSVVQARSKAELLTEVIRIRDLMLVDFNIEQNPPSPLPTYPPKGSTPIVVANKDVNDKESVASTDDIIAKPSQSSCTKTTPPSPPPLTQSQTNDNINLSTDDIMVLLHKKHMAVHNSALNENTTRGILVKISFTCSVQ